MNCKTWPVPKIAVLAVAFLLSAAGHAFALSFTFSDKDFFAGASWGSMDVVVVSADTLSVTYAASSSGVIPPGSQATSFAFATDGTLASVTNPLNATYTWDVDSLTWVQYTGNLLTNGNGGLSQLSNADEFNPQPAKNTAYWFEFAATDPSTNGGQNTNGSGQINPPGVLPGQTDIFYLSFTGAPDFTAPTFDLAGFVDLTGVRLQSTEPINGGSVFLGGQPVPEPGTILLLGSGLLGIGLMRRKKIS